jgi:hypothetical protein
MNMPGFTAQASLSKTSGHYQTHKHAINSRAQMIGTIQPALPGQSFPGTKCTCQKCGSGGGDVVGQCASVCKDKEVYAKGSEPYDYCKAAKARPGGSVGGGFGGGGVVRFNRARLL